jgi:hypothetical protein
MKSRLTAATVALIAALGALPQAHAQTKWNEVKRQDSLLRLQLPGLERSRDWYGWVGDSRHLGVTYGAWQAAPNADFPRGETQYVQAFSEGSVQSRSKLDAADIKKMFGIFKDMEVRVEASLPGSTFEHNVRRFSAAGSSCVAFEIYPTGVDRMAMGGGNGSVAVTGYYCGPRGVALTDTDVQWVLWGNEYAMPPKNTYMRLAAQPATPPSAALRPSGAAALNQATIEQFNSGIAAHNNKDYAGAARSWRPLADQGLAIAQVQLAYLYVNGEGVPKNPGEAVSWFRKAADQGEAAGFHGLGRMYLNGLGVKQDFAEAKKWLDQAIAAYPASDSAQRDQATKERDQAVARMGTRRTG